MNGLSDLWTTRDLLALHMIRGMSSTLFRQLVEQSEGLDDCLERHAPSLRPRMLQENLFTDKSMQRLRLLADEEIDFCQRHLSEAVSMYDSRYPTLLKSIQYPPIFLFVKGELQSPDAPALGIVGTRRCTHYGSVQCEFFSSECARNGLVIVSGLANGIDTLAHKATIKTGGTTYAVVASGTESISPHHAQHLAREIVDSGGAILSEYRCQTKAMPAYFPRRNRIISGIAKSLLLIESGTRGGSLITAQFARDQERIIYALPGNIGAERSAGCNDLLVRNVAQAVTSPTHILKDYGISTESSSHRTVVEFSSELEQRVYYSLSSDAQHADELAGKLNINTTDLLVTLLMLEFKGLVRQRAGKLFVKA